MSKVNGENQNFIGSGWEFPLRISSRGGIGLSSQYEDIDESIRLILGTAKGERHMRPDFGCGIHNLVFAPNNSATCSLISHHVQEALGWWEPRIEVTEIDVHPDTVDISRLIINIKYKIKITNDDRNLVYPFYLSR